MANVIYLKDGQSTPTHERFCLIIASPGIGGSEATQHSLGITMKIEPALVRQEVEGLSRKGVKTIYVQGMPDASTRPFG